MTSPLFLSPLNIVVHIKAPRRVLEATASEAHRHGDGFGTTDGPTQQQLLQLRHGSLPGPVLSHSEKLQLGPLWTLPDRSCRQGLQNCCRSFENVYGYHRRRPDAREERV